MAYKYDYSHLTSIVLVTLLCCTYRLSAHHTSELMHYLLLILIVLFGFPHGLLDPWLYRDNISQNRADLMRFIISYSAIVLFGLVCWWLMPVAMLWLFLLLSAWHFGTDWYIKTKLNQAISALMAGGCVLLWLMVLQPEQSLLLFTAIGVEWKSLWLAAWLIESDFGFIELSYRCIMPIS